MVNGFDFISIAIFAFYFIYRLIYWFFFVCAQYVDCISVESVFYQFRMLFDCFMVFSLSLSFDKMGESVSVLWLQNMNGSGSI